MLGRRGRLPALLVAVVLVLAGSVQGQIGDVGDVCSGGVIGSATSGASGSPPVQASLSSLPAAAQPVVSAALGQDSASYHAAPVGDALQMENRAQALAARFAKRGLEVSADRQHWRLTLRGYGYGERLEATPAAAPQSEANRVEYRRGPVTEWYLTGPLGLEQGFTLARPPRAERGVSDEPLTLALAIDGDLQPSLSSPQEGGGDGGRPRTLTLLDADGRPLLRYTGLTAYDAGGHELPAWLELAKGELRVRVEDAGARYPVTVDPLIQQAQLAIGSLNFTTGISASPSPDNLGTSVAVSGDGKTIAVGRPGFVTGFLDFGNDQRKKFAVDVYQFVQFGARWTWNRTGFLRPSDGDARGTTLNILAGGFGNAVAVNCDGSVIAVGASSTSLSRDVPSVTPGAVYVFVRPATGWRHIPEFEFFQTAKLTPFNALTSPRMGNSVAISDNGNTIVAGARFADVGSNDRQGALYIYTKPPTGWADDSTETARLTASDGAAEAHLGESVGISRDGNTIAGGAPPCPEGFSCGTGVPRPGAVYVFTKPSGGWESGTQTAKLTASDGTNADRMGVSVAISGNTIVAGALPVSPSVQLPGAAYVFVRPAGGWLDATETAKLTASDGTARDAFGFSVGITEEGVPFLAPPPVILVGAPFANEDHGAVYVFTKPNSGWTSTSSFSQKLVAFEAERFGFSVNANPDLTTVAVGAPHSYDQRGTAYAFTGTAFAAPSTQALNLGNVAVGATPTRQVTLTNNGSQDLQVTRVWAGEREGGQPVLPCGFDELSTPCSGPFTSTNNCEAASPLAPGQSCTETVTFAPTVSGVFPAKLAFMDDSNGLAGNTQLVELSGTAILTNRSTTNITSLAPSPALVGTAVAVGYSVAAPEGSGLAASGAVMVTASTSESCMGPAPSGSCALTFPTVGMRTITAAYLGDTNLMPSSSPPAAQSVVDFSIAVSPASQQIIPGRDASFLLTLTAINGFAGTLDLACSGGPINSTCSVSPGSLALPGTGSAQATLSIPLPSCVSGGSFAVTFTATNGGVTRSATANVTIR